MNIEHGTDVLARYSLLPALSLSGIIYTKIVEGSYTTELFLDFLHSLLAQMNPFPAKNSLIIMDNAKIHRNPHIREMIEKKCIECLFHPKWLLTDYGQQGLPIALPPSIFPRF
jgi:hypothetical protein